MKYTHEIVGTHGGALLPERAPGARSGSKISRVYRPLSRCKSNPAYGYLLNTDFSLLRDTFYGTLSDSIMGFDCNLDDSDDMELIEKVSQHGTYGLA